MSDTIKTMLEIWDRRPGKTEISPGYFDWNDLATFEYLNGFLPAMLRAEPDLRALLGQPRVIPPPPALPPSQDPNLRWDDDLGWLHVDQLDAINEMRGELARARAANQPSQPPEQGEAGPSTRTVGALQSLDTNNRIQGENPNTAGTAEAPGQTGDNSDMPSSAPAIDPVSPVTIDAPAAPEPKQRRQSAKRKAAAVPPGLPSSIGAPSKV